jgi:protein SCO1/2
MRIIEMKIAVLLLGCAIALTAVSCTNKSAESASQAHSKQFRLKGKVVSIDDRAKMVNIDSEAIPGFMDAMTMPYKVKPDSELNKLHPGDAITADLLVEDDGAWLQNITVMGHSPAKQNK